MLNMSYSEQAKSIFYKIKTKEQLQNQVKSEFFSSISSHIDTVFDPSVWAQKNLLLDLYSNQTEIVNAIIDNNKQYLVIIGARSSGKSFGVSAGLSQYCIQNPKIRVLVFAPKAEQAHRITEYITTSIITKDSVNSRYIDWRKTTKTKIYFNNGSIISSHSAAITARVESAHGDILVIDESQHVSDEKFSQALSPMIASSKIGKIIKLGVPLFKGHFWKSFNNPQYTKLIHTWLNAPNLYNNGTVEYNGISYPRYCLDMMPFSLKKQIFPDTPSLWTNGEMTEVDFRTQFMMEWLSDINLAFSEKDQLMLIDTPHKPMEREIPGETYYFGLDFAGGEQIQQDIGHDYTALTIWKKAYNDRKELIFAKRMQGSFTDQIEELYRYINPKTGLFRCYFGYADYGNMGGPYVDTMKNRMGINIEGIQFGAKDPQTGKNFKNAMYTHFIYELQQNRVKFPRIDLGDDDSKRASDSVKTLAEAFHEVSIYEKRRGIGSNFVLTAPFKAHDDLVCSALLGVYAADKESFNLHTGYVLPKLILGGPSLFNRVRNRMSM